MISLLENKDYLDSLGILDWGHTTESRALSFDKYQGWLQGLSSQKLNYLTDHRKNLRSDLKEIFPQFESALVFLFPYHEQKKRDQKSPLSDEFKIASYAFSYNGLDYHHYIKNQLGKLVNDLKNQNHFKQDQELTYKICVDSVPLLERDLAYKSGLGWFGKNSMLTHPKYGSYFFIASVLFNQNLDHLISPKKSDPKMMTDHCGSCTACIDACPTEAIDSKSRTLKVDQCLSTYTIEVFKDELPPQGYNKPEQNYIFGCDICLDVCPWNKNSLIKLPLKNNIQSFSKLQSFFQSYSSLKKLQTKISSLSNKEYKKFFIGSVFERLGKKGFLKNLLNKS